MAKAKKAPVEEQNLDVAQLARMLATRAGREARFAHESRAFVSAIEQLGVRLDALKQRHERALAFLDGEISTLAAKVRDETGVRSWSLPFGKVGFRKGRTWTYPEEDAALIAYFESEEGRALTPPGVVPVKLEKSILRTGVKAFVEATGVLPEGVDYQDGETVTIKSDAALGALAGLELGDDDEAERRAG